MRAAGHAAPADSVVEADYSYEAGERAARTLLARHPDLTAIVCGNDYLAIGSLAACRSAGREVPASVSVTGMNDGELARYAWPPLTTVHIPMWEIGERAARYLIERLGGADPAPPGDLPVSLEIRASTGPVAPGRAAGPRPAPGRG